MTLRVLYHGSIRTAIPARDMPAMNKCQCYWVLLDGGRRVLVGVHELDVIKGEFV